MTSTEPVGQDTFQEAFQTNEKILGKDDFLKILVTQLRNQDPLNPMKSEEFAAQLAQFSSVEQLHNINANLESSLQMNALLNQAISNTMATTFIGKSVRALGNAVALQKDQPSTLHYNLAGAAQSVTLEIKNSQGQVVRTVELTGQTAGDHEYRWDGKDAAGNELPEGRYTFSVSAVDANGNSVSAQTLVVGLITGIRYADGNAFLQIGNLDVNISDVIEIGLDKSSE